MNVQWSKEEIDFLRTNASKFSDKELTNQLHLYFQKHYSLASVRKCRQRQGIIKAGHRGHNQVIKEELVDIKPTRISIEQSKRTNAPMKLCSVEGCLKHSYLKDYCQSHYDAWAKYGNPHAKFIKLNIIVNCNNCSTLINQSIKSGLCKICSKQKRRVRKCIGKPPRIINDYTGQIINQFTFIKFVGHQGNIRLWEIQCHCGNIFEAGASNITRGKQRYCCACRTLHLRNKHPNVDNLRKVIRQLIKTKSPKKNNMAFDMLGCSRDFFKEYLEKQFVDGMSWDNYGHRGWHLDHIRPCISFDLTDSNQVKQCFHYTNYQPLWWQDNLKKGAKWTNAA